MVICLVACLAIVCAIAVIGSVASKAGTAQSGIPSAETFLPKVSGQGKWVIIVYDDFNNLTGWNITTGGIGNIKVYATNSTLHLVRTGSMADGGHAGIYKDISPPVHSDYLGVFIVGKINSYTLSNSGWWSEVYGGFGEYPLHFAALTGRTDGVCGPQTVFNWGFLTRNNTKGYLTNYDKVPLGQTFTWWKIVPTYGIHITRIKLFANGWDFNTEVDKIIVAAWQWQ